MTTREQDEHDLDRHLGGRAFADQEAMKRAIEEMRSALILASLVTGTLLCKFGDMHAKAEELMGESIFSHQFAHKPFADELAARARGPMVEVLESIAARAASARPTEDAHAKQD